MTLLLFFFLVSLIFSFLCSIWEAVLLSIPPSNVEILSKEGHWIGKRLKTFKTNIDKPLAAILTLNTIAHTVGAIGVGAQASKIWSTGYSINVLGINFSAEFIVASIMTLAILIFSEIIPKTLGANYWKKLTGFTVYGIHLIGLILFPFVWLSQLVTKSLSKDKDKSVLSRQDFSAMAEIGAEEGILEGEEFRILKNLLRFNKVRAKDIMTPRTVVVSCSDELKMNSFYEMHPSLRFSRIPVYHKEKDHVNGFFLKTDLLNQIILGNGHLPVKTIRREVIIMPDISNLPEVLQILVKKKEHMAVVVDEYGGMAGLVTMEDIIETLLGLEIVDELDNIEDMQKLAREKWNQRAKALGLVDPIDKS